MSCARVIALRLVYIRLAVCRFKVSAGDYNSVLVSGLAQFCRFRFQFLRVVASVSAVWPRQLFVSPSGMFRVERVARSSWVRIETVTRRLIRSTTPSGRPCSRRKSFRSFAMPDALSVFTW